MRESQVLHDCLLFLSTLPRCLAWRAQPLVAKAADGRVIRSLPKGHSDIAGVLDGRALFVECKGDTGSLRPEQQVFRDAVQARGALWILARSVDDIREALR